MPIQREVRTLTNSKNVTLETSLTDDEAIQHCEENVTGKDEAFAKDLAQKAKKYRPSQNQLFWLHKLAMQVVSPETQTPVPTQTIHVGDFNRLNHLFEKALHWDAQQPEQERRTRKLRITFQMDSGEVVQISQAGKESKNAGQLYVNDGTYQGRYYGKIDQQGNLFPSKTPMSQEALDFLRAFAQDPQHIAQAYGAKMGRCMFCGRTVEDEKGDRSETGERTQRGSSVEQGFGLTCARRFGLYHSHMTVAEKETFQE